MMRRFPLHYFVCALLAGCGGKAPMHSPDLSTFGDLAPASTLCSDPRADAYQLPIVKATTQAAFTVSLTKSDPGPPAIGSDTWTIAIADKQGAPLSGATISVKPWMPDHGHGTQVVAKVMAASAPGSYTISPLYLFMAGLWQVTFTIQSGATTDTVMFSFCLAG